MSGALRSIFRRTPIQKLCSLLGDLLAQAARSADDEDALEYIETAAVVTETLVVSAPRLHQQALLAVPQTSGKCWDLLPSCLQLFSTTTAILLGHG